MDVFLSYRRDDSHDVTDRIYDWLIRAGGRHCVFKDVDSIRLGRDFRQAIRDAVGRCDVLLAVIGPGWLTAAKVPGMRRIDDPLDFVRMEIETALERDILIVPLLVNNAAMPSAEDLPLSLRPLAYRNGMPVRPDPDFRRDMERLIAALEPPRRPPLHRWLLGGAVVAASCLALLLAILIPTMTSSGRPQLDEEKKQQYPPANPAAPTAPVGAWFPAAPAPPVVPANPAAPTAPVGAWFPAASAAPVMPANPAAPTAPGGPANFDAASDFAKLMQHLDAGRQQQERNKIQESLKTSVMSITPDVTSGKTDQFKNAEGNDEFIRQ